MTLGVPISYRNSPYNELFFFPHVGTTSNIDVGFPQWKTMKNPRKPGYVHAPATGVAESRLSRLAYGSIPRLVEESK